MEHDDEHTEAGRKAQDDMPEPSEMPGGTLGRDADDEDRQDRFDTGGERLRRAQGADGDVESER